MQRRDFLTATGGLITAATLGATKPLNALGATLKSHAPEKHTEQHTKTSKKLRVLMLGGTGFIGPTIVKEFLGNGHDVTLFNRGITNPNRFLYLERLKGDREEAGGLGLAALKGRDWDIVIDTWQKGPKCVEDTAKLLSGHAGAYYYISSISVYHSTVFRTANSKEDARLSDLEGIPINRSPDAQTYYHRKTLAEKLLTENFDGAVGLLRSHGMRGAQVNDPHDEHYWPVKIWRGGDILAPADGETLAQFTDIPSYCRFLMHCAEKQLSGAYNVMSPTFKLGEFFEAIQNVSDRPVNLVWTPEEKLAEFDIKPYRDLPLWRPDRAGFYTFNTDKAIQAGFQHRSLAACAASMLHGYFDRHPKDDFKFSGRGRITDEKERIVLKAVMRS
jgi:2'-hydroxyisoflavone reductase